MENQHAILDGNISGDDVLHINSTMIQYLSEIAKWAKFLSILGFISIGFLIILAIFIGSVLSSISAVMNNGMNSMIFSSIYLVMAIIYFFPVLSLYKFSNHTKNAITERNNTVLQEAFLNLKSHYKFIGISAIVFLALYVGIIFISIIGAASF
jgi:hypothetical protein